MSAIRLSIITACRNADLFLPGCIDNVAEQATPEVEHLIVDGASTDSSVRIIEAAAARHPHIRWISEPDNGQSQAMNKGIAMARGEVIGFLNADDLYLPGTIGRAREIFATVVPNAFVAANCDLVTRNGRVARRSHPKGLSFEAVLSGEVLPPLNPTSYFYHKALHEAAGLYEEEEHNFMDMKMLPGLLRHARVHYFDETWGIFRLHPQCKTSQNWKKGEMMAEIDALLVDYLRTLPEDLQEPIRERRRLAGFPFLGTADRRAAAAT